jgi:hypothetical protein
MWQDRVKERMMGILSELEGRLDGLLKTVSGEDRRQLNAALAAAKTAEKAVVSRLAEFKPQLLDLIEDAEPAIKQAAGAGVEQLIADVIALLGAVPASPPVIQPNPNPVPVATPPAAT